MHKKSEMTDFRTVAATLRKTEIGKEIPKIWGGKMNGNTAVSKNLEENITAMESYFHDCADIKKKRLNLGINQDVACYLTFIEVAVDMGTAALGETLKFLNGMPREKILDALKKNALGISDATYFDTIEETADGLLTGEAIFFIDGFEKAVKIPDDGYPNMGITEADSEKVIRGSNEGFCDSVKQNAALIRKRIRSPKVKVRQIKKGVRSNTNVYIMYIEDLARTELLEEIENRLTDFKIDGVLDSGILEQLAEKKWYSPFPQFQTTQRPDRAAMSLLEGRAVVLSDNSPTGLILPADYNSFIRTSDDYYSRFEIATFGRILRYLASFFAMTLPGFYLAVTNFHTQILPTTLLLSFAEARKGVPFPAVIEVLIMELSFELLREAGVRLPGAMGNTIGIVGGLIIGQAAVEANLVSPIVVIIVSFTALCSFAIPNEEFATAFRILKFFFIAACSWLGYFGMLLGIMAVLMHLSQLTSFGIPYLMPFVGADLSGYEDLRDAVIRQPLKKIRKRPVFAKRKERTKLVFEKKDKGGK